MITLLISKVLFPMGSIPLATPITISLYYKPYYSGSFMLIDSGVTVDANGNITESPLPSVILDPTQKYVIRAINESCGAIYDQNIIINAYCPPGFTLSVDESFCSMTVETPATPPSAAENSISVTRTIYSVYGSIIFNPGYAVNGVGSFTQISYANTFWVNGVGYPNTVGTTVDGPLNRSGVWSATNFMPQDVGFAVCIEVPADGTYYVALGCDDYGIIRIDGATIVQQDLLALHNYVIANGYPLADIISMGLRFWYIYPVTLTQGSHVIEIIGHNSLGTGPGAASIGCEVYNLTAAQIAAATSYADMGSGLLFSSKDFVGMPIQIGTGGVGYTCPAGYSLRYCDSPIVCVRTITVPILY